MEMFWVDRHFCAWFYLSCHCEEKLQQVIISQITPIPSMSLLYSIVVLYDNVKYESVILNIIISLILMHCSIV